jgi:hypothetical protein
MEVKSVMVRLPLLISKNMKEETRKYPKAQELSYKKNTPCG